MAAFFLASGQTVHAGTMNDANSAQTQSNNNKSAESNAIIMPKSKIVLNKKKLAANKVQLHNQSVTKPKLHKTAALLPQTGEDKDTVIGIIGALAILLALISLKKPKENKKD